MRVNVDVYIRAFYVHASEHSIPWPELVGRQADGRAREESVCVFELVGSLCGEDSPTQVQAH
jgi:hypothetical protein